MVVKLQFDLPLINETNYSQNGDRNGEIKEQQSDEEEKLQEQRKDSKTSS